MKFWHLNENVIVGQLKFSLTQCIALGIRLIYLSGFQELNFGKWHNKYCSVISCLIYCVNTSDHEAIGLGYV